MKLPMYREGLIRLDRRLALESEPEKRQKLVRRAWQVLDELEAAEMKIINPRQAYSGAYWKARAARLRQASALYRSEPIQDHLMQIAAGYENLAERACKIQEDASRQDVIAKTRASCDDIRQQDASHTLPSCPPCSAPRPRRTSATAPISEPSVVKRAGTIRRRCASANCARLSRVCRS